MTNSKNILLVLIVNIATWLLTGCGGGSHDDPRLVAIDSLLTRQPDSALARLNDIEPSSLTNEGNRAYHALLLTQARYRCYITATSDSDINQTLAYYQRHSSDKEKLTRAYIYKGAVAEELGDPEGAMRHYKSAATTVPADDEFLQGYIKLRIGNIYRDHLVADSSDVMMFKEALSHFKQVPDSFYILTCLTEIGSSYYKTNPDSVMPYLTQAREMAQRLREDDLVLINDIAIDEFKAMSSNPQYINEAKNHALALIVNNPDSEDLMDLFMIAALTLAKQNKPDSASLFLNQVRTAQRSELDKLFYFLCQAEIARRRGDIEQYHHYVQMTTHINDSLSANGMQFSLREVEENYDNETLKNEKLRYRSMLAIIVIGGLLVVSLLTLALLVFGYKAKERQRRLKEREDQIEQLHEEAEELSTRLKGNVEMSDKLKDALKLQLKLFTQLVEMHNIQHTDNESRFSKLFEESFKGRKPDLSFWNSLQAYADSTHGNLIGQLRETNKNLIESDLRVLSLCCCHLPTSVIMACMGYNEPHSVYNKKRRIAELLGLKGRLEPFIKAHEHKVAVKDGDDGMSQENLQSPTLPESQ
jgi:tetratricopeptide (TPR) repeat protein